MCNGAELCATAVPLACHPSYVAKGVAGVDGARSQTQRSRDVPRLLVSLKNRRLTEIPEDVVQKADRCGFIVSTICCGFLLEFNFYAKPMP